MANFDTAQSPYLLRTVVRAVTVLDEFLESEEELGVTEVSRRTGLHKSIVFRNLVTLTSCGLLAPGTSEGTYRLGTKALTLGLAYLQHSPLERVSKSHLLSLADECPRFTFHVAILSNTEIVYQKSARGAHADQPPTVIGRRENAYCSALGKILLAYLAPPELEQFLNTVKLEPRTPNTITSPTLFTKELDLVREREWALDNKENFHDRMCVAVPIRDYSGRVTAALSLAANSDDFERYGLDAAVELVKSTAAAVSFDLGYQPAHTI